MREAEVKFHADALVDWKKFLSKWYSAAIRADMAIGEEYESGLYDEYYAPNSNLVKEQKTSYPYHWYWQFSDFCNLSDTVLFVAH